MSAGERALAEEALGRFRSGWKDGVWKPFLSMLAPDFTLRVPVGELRGRLATREEAVRFYNRMRLSLVRLDLAEPSRTTEGGGTVTFEVGVSGTLYGAPYRNSLVLSFDVRDGQVVALREYFGDFDPAVVKAGAGG